MEQEFGRRPKSADRIFTTEITEGSGDILAFPCALGGVCSET